MSLSAPLLEVCNVRKQFSGVLALDNVSASLHRGEVLAVVGENGGLPVEPADQLAGRRGGGKDRSKTRSRGGGHKVAMAQYHRIEEDARRALLEGMNIVADIVGATLGPRGKPVVLGRPLGAALVTKDGVTVARHLQLADPFQNEGAKLIQEVAAKTNTEAGDGTTAATILCRAIFREGMKLVAAGANATAIERGIQAGVECVVKEIARIATPVDQSDFEAIKAVASIAANSDKEMGEVIARAITKVGVEGVCRVATSPTPKTTLEITDGLEFERGLISADFAADQGKGLTTLAQCNIFVTDRRLIDGGQMSEFMQRYVALAVNTPLLIIAEDIAEGALQAMAVNTPRARMLREQPPVAIMIPVKAPGSGPGKKDELQDIAVFTGARPFTISKADDILQVKIEDFGSADEVIITPHRTTIVGGHGQGLRLETRKEEIRARMADDDVKDFEKVQLERRLAVLSASIAIIKIGSSVHVKLLEKRDRVEDSVRATQAALKEGIVPGGGMALIRCLPALRALLAAMAGEQRIGAQIVAQAITQPLHRLASNAGVSGDVIVGEALKMVNDKEAWDEDNNTDSHTWGYNADKDRFEDLVAAGIVDPAKVVRLSLQTSAELAGLLLTAAALVTDVPEPTPQKETTRAAY